MKINVFLRTRMFNLTVVPEQRCRGGVYLDMDGDSERVALNREDAERFADDLEKAARLVRRGARRMGWWG